MMGEAPKGLFFVFEGLVGLYNTNEQGKERLLRIFGKGQCLGHRSLLAKDAYHANARVIEKSQIGFISSKKAMELLATNHEFCFKMLEKLAKELKHAELRLASSTESQVSERVAEAMLYLKETYPTHKWTRNEIAYYCGSTGPTVIRTLSDFEKKGIIKQEGRDILIVDKEELRKIAQLSF